jgi:DNA-binding transcriptional ArsR family regulator
VEASEALQVLASPRRLKILELAWERELARNFDVTWSAISQHITVLKSAGFLVERREGTSRLYRTDREGLGPLRDVVEAQWRQGLMQVKSLAEQEHAREKETE